MNEPTIGVQELDYLELIAADTKKGFAYIKDSDSWAWYNRGDEETQHGEFRTRLEALRDAAAPYLEPDLEKL